MYNFPPNRRIRKIHAYANGPLCRKKSRPCTASKWNEPRQRKKRQHYRLPMKFHTHIHIFIELNAIYSNWGVCLEWRTHAVINKEYRLACCAVSAAMCIVCAARETDAVCLLLTHPSMLVCILCVYYSISICIAHVLPVYGICLRYFAMSRLCLYVWGQ